MIDYRTPGVYIEELPATGPITGVGTSTAAFIGPTQRGPIQNPTQVVNWTQFKDLFGEFVTAPRRYLAYAVRGFFENGGTVAYIVRVSAASRAFLELDDDAASRVPPATPGQALRVEARSEPPAGANIRVRVTHMSVVATRAYKDRADIATGSGSTITLANPADVAKFQPGDVVTVEGSSPAERVQIERIRGDELLLASPLVGGPYTGWVRIANFDPGQKELRLQSTAGIEPGTVLRLLQGSTDEPAVVVERVVGNVVYLEGGGLTQTFSLLASDGDVNVTTYEFGLEFSRAGSPTETFGPLSMDPRHSLYYGRVVQSALVTLGPPTTPSIQPAPFNRPAEVATATPLGGGAPENYAAITPTDYQNALERLEKVDDVNLVCVPDMTDAATQNAVIGHCELLADRFAILDSPPNLPPLAPDGKPDVLKHRALLSSQRGYASLYYPWLRTTDPVSLTGADVISIPPSGHVAGVFARTDATRGVHKAPANEEVRAAVGLERSVDDREQGEINVEGVNAIRLFPGIGRPLIWGARTIAPRSEVAWRYTNVRRLLLYMEESIQEGIRWSVFEPNDLGLWKKLDRSITEFLTRVWRAGALFGATPEQAFYTKIDEEINTAAVRALGQVFIEIGVAPVRPAEFVIVRIGMWNGGSEVTET